MPFALAGNEKVQKLSLLTNVCTGRQRSRGGGGGGAMAWSLAQGTGNFTKTFLNLNKRKFGAPSCQLPPATCATSCNFSNAINFCTQQRAGGVWKQGAGSSRRSQMRTGWLQDQDEGKVFKPATWRRQQRFVFRTCNLGMHKLVWQHVAGPLRQAAEGSGRVRQGAATLPLAIMHVILVMAVQGTLFRACRKFVTRTNCCLVPTQCQCHCHCHAQLFDVI